MTGPLHDQTVLVVGRGSELARAVTLAAGDAGASVVAAGRDQEGLPAAYAGQASAPSTPISPTRPSIRLECDLEAAQVVAGQQVAIAPERQDHPRAPCLVMCQRSRPRGQERRPDGDQNGTFEVFERHLGQWDPLHVPVRDQVE